MKLKKISVGLLSLLALASCGKKQEATEQQIGEYPVMKITLRNAELQEVFPATIKGKEDVEIRPRVEGFIKEIYVDEGTVVKAGQPLFLLDSPSTQAALITAEAGVTSAKAQVETARLNVERTEPLAKKGIVSNVQLETVQNSYQSAKASLDQANATLANAKATQGWVTVTSPVNGVVGPINYRKGSLVSSSSTLATIANTSNVFAYFSLNEKQLMEFLKGLDGVTQAEKIKNIPDVTLTLADGTIYPETGKIETITGTINVTTGAANFRAEFANKDGHLRSGTSGRISIPTHMNDVVIIPQKSTFSLQDKTLVYKVQADSVVQTVISVITTPDGNNYVVTEGLKAGDKIAEDGVMTLRHGAKIKEKASTAK